MNKKAKTNTKPEAQTQASEGFKFTQTKKSILLLALATTGVVSLYAFVNLYDKQETQHTQTQIKTPVIARTELSKKENIDIKLFDETQAAKTPTTVINEVADETTDVKTDEKIKETVQAKPQAKELKETSAELAGVIKSLTQIEVAQGKITQQLTELEKATKSEEIEVLKTKVAKLESLNGNIGNLSKIFLAQQLVLLDNAFKVGGNQNLAIENIHNFAKNVAKNEKVATKLQDLLTLTKQQAIITPQALLFYAQKLENIKLVKLEDNKVDMSDKTMSFIEKVKSLFKSFIVVRKTDEVAAERQEWMKQIYALQEAIIFTDFLKVEKILADQQVKKLGDKDIANFTNLFNTYLKQQLALQATLGSFIEGYKYDY